MDLRIPILVTVRFLSHAVAGLSNQHLYSWLSTHILGIDPQRPKPEKYRATDLKREMDPGRFPLVLSPLGPSPCMIENQPAEQHQLEGLNGQVPQADKSGALFSMYLERADDDDNKVTERWKKECDAILIFVGTLANLLPNKAPTLMLKDVDRSFLSGSRSSSCSFSLGSSAESTGELGGLCRKYLSYTC